MQTIEQLCARHGVDMPHALCVAETSARLFDETQPVHALSARARELLHAGALLHNVALGRGQESHHQAGRDIVIAAPLTGLSQTERAVLACMVAFHEGPVRPEAEPLFKALAPAQQREARVLSAILRLANGLDGSQTQTTKIAKATHDAPHPPPSTLHIHVCGPHSHADAASAERKADLWRATLGPVQVMARLDAPHIAPDDSLAEAGRKVLRYRLDWSGGRAAWAFAAADAISPARVSKLRVTTRRMRNDLRLFGAGLRGRVMRPLDKGLRTWSSALRDVRALDAQLASLDAYWERCDDEARAGLVPLKDAWQRRRAEAASALMALATSDDGEAWLDVIDALASAPDVCAFAQKTAPGEPSHVRHVAEAALWQGLAHVRAFDTLPDCPQPDDLHALRVAIKRLRYTLEALGDVLPVEHTQELMRRCVVAQDVFGPINDAHVAASRARDFAARARPRVPVKGILTFAEAQEKVIENRMAGWRDHLHPLLNPFS
jgi:CHAD domain-containing protein